MSPSRGQRRSRAKAVAVEVVEVEVPVELGGAVIDAAMVQAAAGWARLRPC
jgi:hypothetical protein